MSDLAKAERLRLILSTTVIVLILINLGAFLFLSVYTPLARLVPVANLQDASLYDSETATRGDRARFETSLKTVTSNKIDTEGKILAILNWSVNQVSKVEHFRGSASTWDKVEYARRGGGLLCGDMAQIFHNALIANGIPARRVMLLDHIFGTGDTHVVVEALVDQKWQMFDPTFNVSMRSSGVRLSAIEIHSILRMNRAVDMQLEYFGEKSYPARVENYYKDYKSLYSSVYVEIGSGGIMRFIPMLSVWLGPQWAYQSPDGPFSNRSRDSYLIFYYTFNLILPLVCIGIFLALRLIHQRIGRETQSKPQCSMIKR